MGGPRSASRKRTTTKVVVRFRQFLIASRPANQPYAQRQRIERRRDLQPPSNCNSGNDDDACSSSNDGGGSSSSDDDDDDCSGSNNSDDDDDCSSSSDDDDGDCSEGLNQTAKG